MSLFYGFHGNHPNYFMYWYYQYIGGNFCIVKGRKVKLISNESLDIVLHKHANYMEIS